MADINRTVEIIFGVTDDMSGGLKGISSSLDDFTSKAQGVTQPLANLTSTILTLDAYILGLGVTFAGFAINEAAQFSDALNEINTLISATPDQFSQFSDDILAYAQSSTQSIESINGAVYSAISAGTDYGNSLEVLKVSEQLAVAGKADLNATTIALVSTLNAYGAGTEEASRYSDILFTTVKEGQTTLPELAASLSQVTSIAANSGVPFETLTAAIATLTAKGAPTSEAITGIRQAIVNIIKPTSDAAALASELGIEFNATALQTQGFEGVLSNVREATGGNVELMAKLFTSVEGLGSVLALTGDDMATFNEKLGAMENSAGATAEAFKKMEDNIDLVHQGLVNDFQAMLIQFGGPLLDEYTDIVRAFGELLTSLGKYFQSEDFEPILNMMEAAATRLADFIRGVAQALPEALSGLDLTPIIDALEDLAGAFGNMFGDLDLTQPEDLEEALQALVNVFGGLIRATEGIVDVLGPIARELAAMGAGASGSAPELGGVVGHIAALGAVANTALKFLPGIGTSLEILGASLAVVGASKAVAVIAGLVGGVTALAGGLALLGGYSLGNWLSENTALGDSFTVSLQNIGHWFGYVSEEEKQAASAANILAQKIEYAQKVTGDATLTAENYEAALKKWKAASLEAQSGTEAFTAAVEKWGENVSLVDGRIVVAGEKMDEFGRIAGEVGKALPQEELERLNKLLDTHVTIWTAAGGVLREAAMSEEEIARTLALAGDAAIGANEKVAEFYIGLGETTKVSEGTGLALQRLADSLQEADYEDKALVFHDLATAITGLDVAADARQYLRDLNQAFRDGHINQREYELATQAVSEVLQTLPEHVDFNSEALHAYNEKLQVTKTVGDYTVTALRNVSGVLEYTWTKTKDATKATEEFSSTMVTTASSADDLAKKMNLTASEAADLYVQLEKIASEERIKTMELSVELNIAKLEADTEKAIAAFQSIEAVVQSTGDLLGSLFGNLVDATSSTRAFRLIEDQIDLENKRRQEALDKNNELIDTQVAAWQAQADALSSGDALIKIQADGMEPEIEAFMWKILEKLQARANLEGAEFLLNMATA